jgi:glycosyltransferase involved in cell wall biosynthesis
VSPAPDLAVLLIAHALPPAEHSGVPAAAYEYAKHVVRRGVRAGVLYGGPDANLTAPARVGVDEAHGFKRYEVRRTQSLWQMWSIHDASAAAPDRASVLNAVLDDFRPSLVHIVDLVNLPGEWPEVIKARGIPILRHMCNAEDLCGCIEPVFPAPPAVVCPTPITPAQCAECCFRALATCTLREGTYSAYRLLEDLSTLRAQSIAECERQLIAKREQAERVFGRCYDRIVFQTRSFREYFERTLPLPADRTLVIEQGIDLKLQPAPPPEEASGPIHFLYLGAISAKKGCGDIAAVFSHPTLLNRQDYDLTIYGTGDSTALGDLTTRNPRARYHGGFPNEQFPAILRAADVGLSPSRFETFHRVTREYLTAGLPVIGSTAFGIPDVVRTGENGVLFEPGDVEGFRRAVLSVLDDRPHLARLTAGAHATCIRTKEQEIDDLLAQYNAIMSASSAVG